MKFYIANPELDAQIAEIKKIIRLSMNGIVSDAMIEKGILYKKNFGVAIPRIREIAKRYTPNHDLAQRLWALQIRETMILATLLEPLENFTPEMAQAWAETFDQTEILEQACMNLFCKTDFAPQLVKQWIESDKLWLQITGFVLTARIVEKLDAVQIGVIVQRAIELSGTDKLHLYRSIGLALSRLCRKDAEIAAYILKQVEALNHRNSISEQYILSEVKQEILFLDIL